MRKLLAISTVLALLITVFATAASIPPAAASGWTSYSHPQFIEYYVGNDHLAEVVINAGWRVNDARTQYYLDAVVCTVTWYAANWVGALYVYEVGAINGGRYFGGNQLGLWVDWCWTTGQYASFTKRWYPNLYITLYSGTGKPFKSPGGYPAIDSCYLMWHYRIEFSGGPTYYYMLGLDVARNILYYSTYINVWSEFAKLG